MITREMQIARTIIVIINMNFIILEFPQIFNNIYKIIKNESKNNNINQDSKIRIYEEIRENDKSTMKDKI